MANKLCFSPDSLHINQKNFPSFFQFMEKENIELTFHQKRKKLVTAYGDYKHVQPIQNLANLLASKSKKELLALKIHGVNLFDCCRAELLSFLMPLPVWHNCPFPASREKVFEKAYDNNRQDLLSNMAAAMDWMEHWSSEIEKYPAFLYCCVFSGSLIYQRTLIELMMSTPTRVFVMESSFTGNDYYCEEKYSPIANRSDIRFKSVFSAISIPDDPTEFEWERNKAVNKFLLSQNKNVQQPDVFKPIELNSENKTVVILGQVVNDFSLIETNLSSIYFYKTLIDTLSKNSINIIFKAHPWEEKKNNVKRPLTYSILLEHVDKLPEEQKSRVHIVDHYPIEDLYSVADCVIGLNSQSLIESCFFGHKPLQFGDAFFGGHGFTHDFSEPELPTVVDMIAKEKLQTYMSMDEFRSFENFVTRYFQGHLVSVHNSGLSRLKEIFAPVANISIIDKLAFTQKKKPVQKLSTDSPDSERNLVSETKADKVSSFARKFRKLRRSPFAFFRDSKIPAMRKLKVFFG